MPGILPNHPIGGTCFVVFAHDVNKLAILTISKFIKNIPLEKLEKLCQGLKFLT
jgi:hypothetical protein